MAPTSVSPLLILLITLVLTSNAVSPRDEQQPRASKGDQRGLLPTLGLLALLRLTRPLLFSGGFHSYGSFGSAGAYFNPNPVYLGGVGIPAGIGGVGGFGGATGIAGIPGYPLGYPHHPLGVGPFTSNNNVRGGAAPTSKLTTSTAFNDLRIDEGQPEAPPVPEATPRPGLLQYLQEAASPLVHAGQAVQSRHMA